MVDFKVGDIVEELDYYGGDKWPRSQGLIVRIPDEGEFHASPNNPIVEVQWITTGAKSILYSGDIRRAKR